MTASQWRSARRGWWRGSGWTTAGRGVAIESITEYAAAQLGHSGIAVTERNYVERTTAAPDHSDVLEVLADDAAARDRGDTVGWVIP